jgi:hypothetical protein
MVELLEFVENLTLKGECLMAKFGSIIGKVAAGALALGGLILAGKTGFGKNLGEDTAEGKDPLALEPLGCDLDDDGTEETAPEEEGGDEEA